MKKGIVSDTAFAFGQNAFRRLKVAREAFPKKVTFSGKTVTWSCPQCGHTNIQKFYGRAHHVCLNCDVAVSISAP